MLLISRESAIENLLFTLLLGGILIGGVGLLDDKFNLPVKPRLFFQLFFSLFICFFGLSDRISFFGQMELHGVSARIFQILWLLSCINIYNFMDGLDGLAGMQGVFITFITCVFLFFDSRIIQNSGLSQEISESLEMLGVTLLFLSAVISAFLLRNFYPSTIFMGDSGSHFLGFILGFLALAIPDIYYGLNITSNYVGNNRLIFLANFGTIAIFLMPFFLDSGLTILRRLHEKKNIFQAHRGHLYQLLNRNGKSPPWIVGFYFTLNLSLTVPFIFNIVFNKTGFPILFSSIILSLHLLLFKFSSARLIKKIQNKDHL
ncbi:MAG: hypothetical protein OEZ34_17400 [Spirochaetia bacterium]|nr:hypothetical protein [Spirochaetia bacterium]